MLKAVAAMLLLAAAAGVTAVRNPVALAGAAAAALALRTVLSGWRHTARVAVPVALFAGMLAGLQALAGSFSPVLPLRSAAVVFFATTGAAVFPWRAAARIHPRSRAFPAALFLLAVAHFTGILGAEAHRLLAARKLAMPRPYGPAWFLSLVWALAAVFRTSLTRAERFYAALWLGGFAS